MGNDKKEQVKETEKQQVESEQVKETAKQNTTSGTTKKKSVKQLVQEVVRGQHGTGRDRMRSLGDQYEAVQHEVNQLIKKGEV